MDQLTLLEIQDVQDRQFLSGLAQGYEPSDPAWQKQNCETKLKGRWIVTDQGGFCVAGEEKSELEKKARCHMPAEFSCTPPSVFDEVSCTCVWPQKTPWWPWAVAGGVALVALILAVRK